MRLIFDDVCVVLWWYYVVFGGFFASLGVFMWVGGIFPCLGLRKCLKSSDFV